MTQDELDNLKKITDAASPNPWTAWCVEYGNAERYFYYNEAGEQVFVPGWDVTITGECNRLGDFECSAFLERDAKFIEAAREYMPKLIEEIELLRKRVLILQTLRTF